MKFDWSLYNKNQKMVVASYLSKRRAYLTPNSVKWAVSLMKLDYHNDSDSVDRIRRFRKYRRKAVKKYPHLRQEFALLKLARKEWKDNWQR